MTSAAHKHEMGATVWQSRAGNFTRYGYKNVSGSAMSPYIEGAASMPYTQTVGGGEAHENRPPYVGLFLIKRL